MMTMEIISEPIDICPLCRKKIDSLQPKSYSRLTLDGDFLFFAHRECIEIVTMFVQKWADLGVEEDEQ